MDRRITNTTKSKNLFPKHDLVTFMHDGETSHTTKLNNELTSSKIKQVWSKSTWPGNSPYLNPVEHVWSILQDSVFLKPRPEKRQELIDRVKLTWYDLKPEYLEKLAQSLFKHVNQVRDRDVRKTDY